MLSLTTPLQVQEVHCSDPHPLVFGLQLCVHSQVSEGAQDHGECQCVWLSTVTWGHGSPGRPHPTILWSWQHYCHKYYCHSSIILLHIFTSQKSMNENLVTGWDPLTSPWDPYSKPLHTVPHRLAQNERESRCMILWMYNINVIISLRGSFLIYFLSVSVWSKWVL